MKSDKRNQFHLDLKMGGALFLADMELTVHADDVQGLALDIADMYARMRMIRWFGRLLDVMDARLSDRPVRPSLVGRRDIPDVTVGLGTAWAWLYWPGGHMSVSAGDVEQILVFLGVDIPVQCWRQYCRREAEKVGTELNEEFLA